MKNITLKGTALVALMLMSATALAQNDSLSADTTQWYNQTQQIGGVTVKGRLPKTRVKGDVMRTIVAGSILEKAGTISDALNRIPLLEAERDAGVKVIGRGEAEVYINGRKVLDEKELSRLRSDQIQFVDVVQNPGARYAASTKAVVRIQLKKEQGEGFSFQDYVSSMYQYDYTLTNNIVANYRIGGLDITTSFWAGRYGHSKSLQDNNLSYFVGPDYIEGISSQESKNIWKGWSPQLQVNYMVSENHSFGAFYKYDRHPNGSLNGWFYTDEYKNGIYKERSESHITQEDEFIKHIFNAYYSGKVGQLSIDLNIDGLFDDSRSPGSTNEQTIGQTDVHPQQRSIESNTISGNNFWASKLILGYPIWKGNLSMGGEYTYNNRTDAYDFTATDAVPVKATDNEINEKSIAAFVEYGRQFGKLFTQVGLRYEHLRNDYYNFGKREDEVCRDYGDWFPTATLAMPIGKMQFSLSYRRDIERPVYSNLTSSTIYINRYTYQSGNPYLRPKYTHSLMLNSAYKWANLTVNYQQIKDATTLATEPYPGATDPLISLVRTINSQEDYHRLMVNVAAQPSFQFPIFNSLLSWHPMWNATIIFQDYKSPCANGSVITLNHPYFNLSWKNDFELPKNWRINVTAMFTPKGDMNNFRLTRATFNSSIGLQYDVILHKVGTLNFDLRCYDPLQTNKNEGLIYGIREITTYNPARRTFMLDLNWKFNEARSKYRGSGAGDKQKARM